MDQRAGLEVSRTAVDARLPCTLDLLYHTSTIACCQGGRGDRGCGTALFAVVNAAMFLTQATLLLDILAGAAAMAVRTIAACAAQQ